MEKDKLIVGKEEDFRKWELKEIYLGGVSRINKKKNQIILSIKNIREDISYIFIFEGFQSLVHTTHFVVRLIASFINILSFLLILIFIIYHFSILSFFS